MTVALEILSIEAKNHRFGASATRHSLRSSDAVTSKEGSMTLRAFLLRSQAIAVPSPLDVMEVVAEHLMHWQETYRQRKHLASLDDVALKDIGLSRADVAAELRKPVWRR